MEEIIRPGPFGTELIDRLRLSDKTVELQFSRPSAFAFRSGQRIRFLRGDWERDYSLISSPDEPSFRLCVGKVPGGAFSTRLVSAPLGARFRCTDPHGYFTFRRSSRQPVFVATGTGIAPFVSMAKSGIRGFILLHGVREPEDLYYASFFRSIPCIYVPCISGASQRSQDPVAPFRGRVTDYLETRLEPEPYDFYLCGGTAMIRDAILMIDDRFSDSHVYTEVFF